MRRQLYIRAMLDSDVDKILDKLGMLDLINDSKIKCSFCEQKVGSGNLYCIYVQGGQLKFCCNRIECYEKIAEYEIKESNG